MKNNVARCSSDNSKKYYEFYHATSQSIWLLQDIYYDFYKKRFPDKKIKKDFCFLRFTDKYPAEQFTDMKDYLAAKINETGIIDDHHEPMRSDLLSVNFTPFGNYDVGGESTFKYFMEAKNASEINEKVIETMILEITKINKVGKENILAEAIKKFKEVINSIEGYPGSLIQILIDEEIVDTCSYTCWQLGVPFVPNGMHLNALIKIFGGLRMNFERLRRGMDQFHHDFKTHDEKALKAKDFFLLNLKNGAYNVSTYLDKLVEKKGKIAGAYRVQGRILLNNTLLDVLNPEDTRIMMFRNHLVLPDDYENYRKKKEEFVEFLFENSRYKEDGLKKMF